MGVSIYYAARRTRPLSEGEQTTIARLIAGHDTDRFAAAGGEPFGVWDRLEDGEIFAGSTKLPLGDAQDATDAVTHWLALLTNIRRAIPDADWRVHIDDHDLPWNATDQTYSLA